MVTLENGVLCGGGGSSAALPLLDDSDGIQFNPASAGPRRFDYPVSVGLLEKNGAGWSVEHVPLDERSVDALTKRVNQL